jgi:hypothetical protein
MRPPPLTPCQWPPVPLDTLSHQVSLVPLARLRLRELLALLVPHRLPSPLRHILVLLLATLSVLPVFLPLLPLSLHSSRWPEHVSFLHTSHENARLEGLVHPSDTIRSCLETQSILFFCPIWACSLFISSRHFYMFNLVHVCTSYPKTRFHSLSPVLSEK